MRGGLGEANSPSTGTSRTTLWKRSVFSSQQEESHTVGAPWAVHSGTRLRIWHHDKTNKGCPWKAHKWGNTHTGPLTGAGTASSSDLPQLVSTNSSPSSREQQAPLSTAGPQLKGPATGKGPKRGSPCKGQTNPTGSPGPQEGRALAGGPQAPLQVAYQGSPQLSVWRAH